MRVGRRAGESERSERARERTAENGKVGGTDLVHGFSDLARHKLAKSEKVLLCVRKREINGTARMKARHNPTVAVRPFVRSAIAPETAIPCRMGYNREHYKLR